MSGEIPRRLSEQARWQAGVITRKHALDSGISPKTIEWKINRGVWRQVYWGVYVIFTGPLTREAQLWAAVLYLEQGWRFGRGVQPRTSIEETIIDLAQAATDRDDVVAYVTAAFARKLTSEEWLRKEIAARKKLRWRVDLDEITQKAAGGTHSVLEYRYDRDVENAHGLPAAIKQAPFTKPGGGMGRRDRYYEKYGLIIELDGRRFHPEERRRLDRDRDNDAAATTGSTLRYGWDDVTRKRCATAAQVHAVLTRSGYSGRLKPCSPTCAAQGSVPQSARPPIATNR